MQTDSENSDRPPEPPAATPRSEQPLTYDLNGGDLFILGQRVAFLSLITLGIYRFWGKTEIRRTLWSALSLRGDRLAAILRRNRKFILFEYLPAHPLCGIRLPVRNRLFQGSPLPVIPDALAWPSAWANRVCHALRPVTDRIFRPRFSDAGNFVAAGTDSPAELFDEQHMVWKQKL
jgi:hypothetical protein